MVLVRYRRSAAAVRRPRRRSMPGLPTEAQKAFQKTGATSTTSSRTRSRSMSATQCGSCRVGSTRSTCPAGGARELPLITPPGQQVSGSWTRRTRRSGSTARTSSASTAAAQRRRSEVAHVQRLEGGPQRAAAREQAEADDGQVHEDRDIPLLLRRPSRHDRHRQGRLAGEGALDGSRTSPRSRSRPRRTCGPPSRSRRAAARRTRSTSAPGEGQRQLVRLPAEQPHGAAGDDA